MRRRRSVGRRGPGTTVDPTAGNPWVARVHGRVRRPAIVLAAALVGAVGLPAVVAADDEPGPVVLATANLVVDGGFEPPGVDDVGSYTGYTAAESPQLGGWTVLSAGVDLVGADPAAEGTQFVDLNGNDESAPGSISQVVATTAGHRYRVQFQLAGNPNGDPPVKTLQVGFGDVSRSFTFDVGETTNDTLGWAAQEFEATRCGTQEPTDSTTLTFTSTTDGQRGPLIDAVSVVDLGPSCNTGTSTWQWVMLGGTGAAWLAAFVFLGIRLTQRRRIAPGGPRPAPVGRHGRA